MSDQTLTPQPVPVAPPTLMKDTFTVRELLFAVKDAVLAEPKRIDMCTWIRHFQTFSSFLDLDEQPACGTVGCLAGWAAVLCRPFTFEGEVTPNRMGGRLADRASVVMEHVLGWERRPDTYTNHRTVGDLFTGDASREFGEPHMPSPGTVAQAELVARRIDLYLDRHPEIADRTETLVQVQAWLNYASMPPMNYVNRRPEDDLDYDGDEVQEIDDNEVQEIDDNE